ncbi:MAG: hypothetical protein IKS48_02990 [Eubacterium sp.]|nr:hypothetical protein [Eubacterium sp.]
MRRLKKVRAGFVMALVVSAIMTTPVVAQTNNKHCSNTSSEESASDLEMPTIEDTVDFSPGFDLLETYQIEGRVQAALAPYDEAYIYNYDVYTYDNDLLNDCVNYSIPWEIYMYDLKTMSENGLGEFKIGNKTFDDGIWWVEWYDDSETCAADCDQSEYEEVVSNLDTSKWEKTDDNTYETNQDENDEYYMLKYYPDGNIISLTKYIRKGHGPEFNDLM